MRKFTMFFMSSLICLCGCFTACSGNSDDNGEEPDNGEVTGPITLTVDKAKIEANGTFWLVMNCKGVRLGFMVRV